ncbi:putative ESX-1 scaffolding and assembly protein SaeA [Gordonia spumicola]|uniref:Putative ESX-1 scaffolding and assembly protein SaeA n=1 Tax=Gordonia spumicola TaxID=589161 RepID=A0A7I9V6K6_9ACTN|nr:hypothetical protein [Gordonia spumicola]GEE00701.1 putative ESX-1 scaffolding and assembly protein SaeA [Gordonia spumicola]
MTASDTVDRLIRSLAAADLPAPAPERVDDFRVDPRGWTPDGRFEVVWFAEMTRLIEQVERGVLPEAAVALTPTGTRRALTEAAPDPTPSPEPTPIVDPDPDPEPVDPEAWRPLAVEALIAWRTEQMSLGVAGAESIRDITLRNLVKFNRTSESEIASALIGPASELAGAIAAVIAEFAPVSETTPAPEPVRVPRHAAPADQPVPVAPRPTAVEAPAPAAPVLTTAPVPPPAPAGPTLTHADFAEYAFGLDSHRDNPIRIEQTATSTDLSWEPFTPDVPGQTVIYRLVSGDDVDPYKPEAGDLLAADGTTSFVDTRFLTSAVRYYQVWAHVGRDETEARRAQPIRLASGEAISPVDDFELFEEEGRIIGRWSARPGTRCVRVTRRSLDDGHHGETPIADGDSNLTGFVDDTAVRGRRFLYRVCAEVEVKENGRLSPFVQRDVLVSVKLTPVHDLRAESTAPDRFDVVWTAPSTGQRVDVFLTRAAPQAGLDLEDLDASALEYAGLTGANQVKDPIRAAADGRAQIVGMRWPSDWDRAYLTPVTSFNGRVRVGRTEVFTRPIPAVVEPRIVERLDTQLVVFGWPQGASSVQVHVGVEPMTPDEICQGTPIDEASQTEYHRDGSIILRRPLQAEGCVVCVVPIAYSDGRQLRGEITTLTYRGLRRMSYSLTQFGQQPDPGVPQPPQVRRVVNLSLAAPTVIDGPPPLVAVFNPERLPLDAKDGQHLQFTAPNRQQIPHATFGQIRSSTHPIPTGYTLDLTNLVGHVRVFVYSRADEPARYALQDPPIDQLQLLPPDVPGMPRIR